MNESNYRKLRNETRKLYSETRPLYSHALNKIIIFNAHGFKHILYKGSMFARDRESQELRMSLFPIAIRLIKRANLFQEYEERLIRFKIKTRKRHSYSSKSVHYWGIIAIFEGQKIKVVLRRVGNGEIHFWSIIPNCVTSKYRDEKLMHKMKAEPRIN